MHSFEVNIRICQPKKNDGRGEHHFQAWAYPDVNRKRMHQLVCYMTLHVSLFLVLYKVFFFIFMNLLKSDVPCTLKTRFFQHLQVSETLMRCAKELHLLNNCSLKMNKFLIQNIKS